MLSLSNLPMLVRRQPKKSDTYHHGSWAGHEGDEPAAAGGEGSAVNRAVFMGKTGRQHGWSRVPINPHMALPGNSSRVTIPYSKQ